MTQKDLESATGMRQSRISAIETPGATNPSIDTLARLAAAYKVGMIVKYAPMSEVVRWENRFSQDNFDVVELEEDEEFLNPSHKEAETGSTGLYLVANSVHGGEIVNVSKGGFLNGKGQQGSYNLPTETNGTTRQGVGV
jgi:transcriptional regulator with XRE-family HTH domain